MSATNCGGSLAAGKSCSISVTFTPTVGGSRSGTLAVTDNAAGSPQTAALSGTGLNALTVSPASLSFGKVAVGITTTAKTVTVTNNQSVSAGLNESRTGTNPGDFTISAAGTTCGAILGAKASCLYSITFTPSATGSRNAILSISDSPDPSSPYSVTLGGTGK